jgi:hypothetical protein
VSHPYILTLIGPGLGDRPFPSILPIGADRTVEDQCQEWRLRHRVRALDGDLARFNAGSPGGWRSCRARRALALVAARWLRPVPGAWSAPTPPWPGGPKYGTRRPACDGFPGERRLAAGRELRRMGVSACDARRWVNANCQPRPGALEVVETVLTDAYDAHMWVSMYANTATGAYYRYMDQELVELATSGAQTIVRLMAADAWGTVRDRVARLFDRKSDQSMEPVLSDLDASRSRIVASAGESKTLVEQEEQDRWEARIRILLIDTPSIIPLLTELISANRSASSAEMNSGFISLRADAKDNARVYQQGYGIQRNS